MASQMSCGGNVARSSCGMARAAPSSEHEEDEEGDGEAEEPGRLGERESQECERRHLRRGITRERIDQRAEHIADADAGADEGDAGKARADHFCRCYVHDLSSRLE